MKRTTKKLELRTQTVRALVAEDLDRVAGGTSIQLSTSVGPVRCTTAWSGCSNNDTFDCIIQPGPIGGGGYVISRYTC
ncbi:MAG TPA: hypothetical protein VIV11_00120 [Kofleriaceae bacterium]